MKIVNITKNQKVVFKINIRKSQYTAPCNILMHIALLHSSKIRYKTYTGSNTFMNTIYNDHS